MYIVSYIKLVGYAPSVTEISERVDAGRATVWKHINNLVDDGLLKTNHPSTDRAYTPVGYGIRKISKENESGECKAAPVIYLQNNGQVAFG